jgi:hypothetical protein
MIPKSYTITPSRSSDLYQVFEVDDIFAFWIDISDLSDWCTPGMGVNLSAVSSRPRGLWGESPLYVKPVNG